MALPKTNRPIDGADFHLFTVWERATDRALKGDFWGAAAEMGRYRRAWVHTFMQGAQIFTGSGPRRP